MQAQQTLPLNHILHILVLCCKSVLTDAEKQLLYTYFQNCSCHLLFHTASQHGVLPLLYHTLLTLFPGTYPTEEIKTELEKLRKQVRYLAQKNMFMSAELIKMFRQFQSLDIKVLAFKGPTLAQSAYGDITLRQYGDLDILIKQKDVPKVIALMKKNGYSPDVHIPKGQTDHLHQLLTTIGFDKPSSSMRIEVHWELLSLNYAVTWDTEALWQKTDTVTINRSSLPTLAFEHLLPYICVHGSKHLFERMEWICDIDRIVRAQPDIDWEKINSHAKHTGIERMYLLGLSLAHRFFDLPLPSSILTKIEQDTALPKLTQTIIALHFSDTEQHIVDKNYFFILLRMRERFTDKLRFGYQAFFAPQFNDFNYLPLPRYLHFLYPLVRIYRLGQKYLFTK